MERGFRVLSAGFALKFRVRPKDILLQESGATAAGSFGKHEVELEAGHLVSFFQDCGEWSSFNSQELWEYYTERGWDPVMMLFGLHGVWCDDGGLGNWKEPEEPWVVRASTGVFLVTEAFVNRCLQAQVRNAA